MDASPPPTPHFPRGPLPTSPLIGIRPAHGAGRDRVEFDFPGVQVGTAEYDEGPTGATVLHIPAGARTAVDVRGGAPGVSGAYNFNHAICFAGGSVYGLAAAAGVSEALFSRSGYRSGFDDLQLVSGAIIYDFSVRANSVYPDAALGVAALDAARDGAVEVGRVGAGASATAGKMDPSRVEFTGQGAAFRQVGDVKVLVLTVLNPFGVVVGRQGQILRGNYHARTGDRRHLWLDYEEATAATALSAMAGNTTLTAVVTNVRLTEPELRQFGTQVHSSMHRGIQPFHTSFDGDSLFAMTTGEVALPANPQTRHGRLSLTPTTVATLASEVAWDAVISAAG